MSREKRVFIAPESGPAEEVQFIQHDSTEKKPLIKAKESLSQLQRDMDEDLEKMAKKSNEKSRE